jgi:cytoskeletal protein RodZ
MSADTSPTLGEFLRQERERRGVTIEQVASATKISVRLLHSLEADHYADLPAKPFVRGFVTSYARFIGIDPKETLTRFDRFIDSKAQDRPSREAGHSGYAFEKREGEQSRTILWFVMGGFVIVGGLVIFFLKPTLRHHRPTQADKLRAVHALGPSGTPVAEASAAPPADPAPAAAVAVAAVSPLPSPAPSASPSETPSPSPSPSPSPTPSPTPAPSPTVADEKPDPLNSGVNLRREEIRYKAIFKATKDVRVRYRVDDRPVMTFILRTDRILVLRAQKEIRFQVSHADGVTFSVNGGAAKLLNADKNFAMRQDTPTLVFPVEMTGKIDEPFPGEKKLPTFVPPEWRKASPSSTPSP